MKKIFSISKDNHSGLVRKLTIVHEYMHFTDNSFFDKGSFNNYVDKMRGEGVKKVCFCPHLGYKNCPRRGRGSKNGKILST